MTIYYVFLISLGIVSILTLDIKNTKLRNKIIIGVSAIFIIAIQGLRAITVGVDVPGYILGYHMSGNMNFFLGEKLFNYEIGYSLLNQFLNNLNISDQYFLAIISAMIIIPISKVWIENSKMPALSVLLYMAFGFFTFTFSGLRQSIAIAILFYSFSYIQKKHIMKFLLSVFIACTFHKTAIIFLVAYPLYYITLKGKHYVFIVPLFIICFIFKQQIFERSAFIFKGEFIHSESTGAYGLFIFMIIVLVISYLFYTKIDANVNAYRNYILVAVFFQMLASQSNLIGRVGYYFWIFITLLVPEVLKNQKKGLNRYIYSSLVIIFLVIYCIRNLSSGYLNVAPYVFFFQ